MARADGSFFRTWTRGSDGDARAGVAVHLEYGSYGFDQSVGRVHEEPTQPERYRVPFAILVT